jgi:hypothetical protein
MGRCVLDEMCLEQLAFTDPVSVQAMSETVHRRIRDTGGRAEAEEFVR